MLAAAMEFMLAGRQLAPLTPSDEERSEIVGEPSQDGAGAGVEGSDRVAYAESGQNKDVAGRLGLDGATVGKWRRRFAERCVDGLRDPSRSGAPRTIDDARIEAVIVTTLESVPKDATHWSSRGMAKTSDLSVSVVQRI